MRQLFIIIFVLLLTVGVGTAQQSDVASLNRSVANAGLGLKPAVTPWSLIDISRITWSNSYAVSFFSGGGTSGSVGLLNTQMNYEILSNLHLTLNLGVLHNLSRMGSSDNEASFLPGFRLDYRPSDKVFMSVSFQRYQAAPWSSRDYRYARPAGGLLTDW